MKSSFYQQAPSKSIRLYDCNSGERISSIIRAPIMNDDITEFAVDYFAACSFREGGSQVRGGCKDFLRKHFTFNLFWNLSGCTIAALARALHEELMSK